MDVIDVNIWADWTLSPFLPFTVSEIMFPSMFVPTIMNVLPVSSPSQLIVIEEFKLFSLIKAPLRLRAPAAPGSELVNKLSSSFANTL